jgi:hypothetical protein
MVGDSRFDRAFVGFHQPRRQYMMCAVWRAAPEALESIDQFVAVVAAADDGDSCP